MMSLKEFSKFIGGLLLLLFVVKTDSQECGCRTYDSTVGELTTLEDRAKTWPWMVAITRRGRSNTSLLLCSGFLIDARHVLSAAHCYETRDPDLYGARIGNINLNEAPEYLVTRIDIPALYTQRLFYDDIAILTLDKEVNFPNFNPICLPNEEVSRMDLRNRGTTVVGWGTDRPQGKPTVSLQLLRQLLVLTNKQCQRVFNEKLGHAFHRYFPRGINRDIICAEFTEDGKDDCRGDSGGPLMIQHKDRWYAIGISSFGYYCGRSGVPGGYTNISNYLDWINEHTGNQSSLIFSNSY